MNINISSGLATSVGLFSLLASVASPCAVQSTYTVTMSPSVTYQTIEDFGASDCWTAEFVGKYFPNAEKDKAAKWLFSKDFDSDGNPLGIGLSAWRVNLGGGSAEQGSDSGIDDVTRRASCYLTSADGSYDWSRCSGQRFFMEAAKDYGVEHFVLFSNSAPVYFTKNGKACANEGVSGSNLSDDKYEAFATYLATVADHFSNDGYNVSLISPLNEPQYDWTSGQEGTPMTNECIAKLVRQLDTQISNFGLDTKILIPEACQFKALYTNSGEKRADNQIDAFFNSANSDTYVGDLANLRKAVAGHSYWTFGTNSDLENVRTNVHNAAAQYGLDVFQTEWSMLDAAPSSEAGFPASYDDASYWDIALYMAKLIHCDLTYANAASWSYWTTFAQEMYSQKNRFYLIRLLASGDSGSGSTGGESYGDISKGGTVYDSPNLWVLGNFCRFIRPGYVRIQHVTDQAESLNRLLGSAYVSPDGKRIVAVYVNMSDVSLGVKLNINGVSTAKITRYTSDESNNLKHDSGTYALGGRIVLKKRSVNTFVIDLGGSAAITDINADGEDNESHDVFSLDGRLVRHGGESLAGLAPGLYVSGGKRLIVK